MLKKIILSILFALPFLAMAEDVELTMSVPNVVELNQQFRLSISVNKDAKPKLPSLNDFNVLYGPSIGRSSSVQFINGKSSSSEQYTYTYVLSAKKEGTFKIQPATVNVDGKNYQSNSSSVQVVKGGSQQASGSSSSRSRSSSSGTEISSSDLFATVSLNKTKAYKGEQIIAEIKIYASPKVSISGLSNPSFPSFEGFYTQDIDQAQQVNFERKAYNDKIYQVATLKRTILFPQKSGELTIDPFEIDCRIRQSVSSSKNGFFDGMFNNFTNVTRTIKSRPIKVNVQDIPNQPTGYNGAVGQMEISSSIDKTEAKANDAITLKLTVTGSGNMRLMDIPEVNFPEDFEVYDPEKSENLRSTSSGQQGSVTFEYLIIPRYAGEYTIPAIKLTSFNPKTGKYDTSSSEAYDLKIAKGDPNAQVAIVTPSGVNKEDVQQLGQDIRYIKQGQYPLREPKEHFFNSTKFWLIYIVSAIIFIIITLLYRKRLKENADVKFTRNKQANKVAKKRLKAAANYLKNNETELFYESILKSFWGYLSDKLNIPASELNRDNASKTLASHQVDEQTIKEFIDIIHTCEYARYAPSAATDTPQQLYDKSADLMGKLEKQIR